MTDPALAPAFVIPLLALGIAILLMSRRSCRYEDHNDRHAWRGFGYTGADELALSGVGGDMSVARGRGKRASRADDAEGVISRCRCGFGRRSAETWREYHCPRCGRLNVALYRAEHADPERGRTMRLAEIAAECRAAGMAPPQRMA